MQKNIEKFHPLIPQDKPPNFIIKTNFNPANQSSKMLNYTQKHLLLNSHNKQVSNQSNNSLNYLQKNLKSFVKEPFLIPKSNTKYLNSRPKSTPLKPLTTQSKNYNLLNISENENKASTLFLNYQPNIIYNIKNFNKYSINESNNNDENTLVEDKTFTPFFQSKTSLGNQMTISTIREVSPEIKNENSGLKKETSSVFEKIRELRPATANVIKEEKKHLFFGFGSFGQPDFEKLKKELELIQEERKKEEELKKDIEKDLNQIKSHKKIMNQHFKRVRTQKKEEVHIPNFDKNQVNFFKKDNKQENASRNSKILENRTRDSRINQRNVDNNSHIIESSTNVFEITKSEPNNYYSNNTEILPQVQSTKNIKFKIIKSSPFNNRPKFELDTKILNKSNIEINRDTETHNINQSNPVALRKYAEMKNNKDLNNYRVKSMKNMKIEKKIDLDTSLLRSNKNIDEKPYFIKVTPQIIVKNENLFRELFFSEKKEKGDVKQHS